MRPPLILIAEDCDETRAAYAELFRAHGFRVAATPDGAAALRSVQTRVPDLVLTDIDMPLLDGIGLARRLRAQRETAELPIVAVTATTLNRVVSRARESGCNAILLKPCGAQALLDAVRIHLHVAPPSSLQPQQRMWSAG